MYILKKVVFPGHFCQVRAGKVRKYSEINSSSVLKNANVFRLYDQKLTPIVLTNAAANRLARSDRRLPNIISINLKQLSKFNRKSRSVSKHQERMFS